MCRISRIVILVQTSPSRCGLLRHVEAIHPPGSCTYLRVLARETRLSPLQEGSAAPHRMLNQGAACSHTHIIYNQLHAFAIRKSQVNTMCTLDPCTSAESPITSLFATHSHLVARAARGSEGTAILRTQRAAWESGWFRMCQKLSMTQIQQLFPTRSAIKLAKVRHPDWCRYASVPYPAMGCGAIQSYVCV